MSELVEAAAEPLRFERNGKEYRLKPLTIGDSAEIERWAEQQVWDELKRRLNEATDPETKKLLTHRLATITKMELREEARGYIEGPESDTMFLWLMLKHEHSEITQEECAGLLTTREFNQFYAELEGLRRIDKITEMEQQFFSKTLPGMLAKLDDPEDHEIEHPADLIAKLRAFWDAYRKETVSDRPPEEA